MVGPSASDATDADERDLVERAQRGDAAAYDMLVRRHLGRATAVARRLLGNIEDAEDLVQESFVRALDRIATFDANRAFAPWFYRLLINAGLNARKARALRAAEPEQREFASRGASPLEMTERQEIRDRFAAALHALPPRQRLVVAMFEVDGLSTAEIADALGISRETVRWHHHQARQSLRKALEPLWNDAARRAKHASDGDREVRGGSSL
ncbi:MAG TPA: sigma-70 family RNA polymerase sigma factor [Gemmatimonadaceae bacterium]|jgi:RNA polymerase sigma-70 factor (ECF subfamily)